VRQRETVLALIQKPTTKVPDLIDKFISKIEAYAHN